MQGSALLWALQALQASLWESLPTLGDLERGLPSLHTTLCLENKSFKKTPSRSRSPPLECAEVLQMVNPTQLSPPPGSENSWESPRRAKNGSCGEERAGSWRRYAYGQCLWTNGLRLQLSWPQRFQWFSIVCILLFPAKKSAVQRLPDDPKSSSFGPLMNTVAMTDTKPNSSDGPPGSIFFLQILPAGGPANGNSPCHWKTHYLRLWTCPYPDEEVSRLHLKSLLVSMSYKFIHCWLPLNRTLPCLLTLIWLKGSCIKVHHAIRSCPQKLYHCEEHYNATMWLANLQGHPVAAQWIQALLVSLSKKTPRQILVEVQVSPHAYKCIHDIRWCP